MVEWNWNEMEWNEKGNGMGYVIMFSWFEEMK